MVNCVAYGCTNRSSKKVGITFHSFPQDPNRRALWIRAVGRDNWQPSIYSKLCSVHFLDEDLDRTSLSCVRVREHAVPSIFPQHIRKAQETNTETARDYQNKLKKARNLTLDDNIKQESFDCTEDPVWNSIEELPPPATVFLEVIKQEVEEECEEELVPPVTMFLEKDIKREVEEEYGHPDDTISLRSVVKQEDEEEELPRPVAVFLEEAIKQEVEEECEVPSTLCNVIFTECPESVGAVNPPPELHEVTQNGGEQQRQKTTSERQVRVVRNTDKPRLNCRECSATFGTREGLRYHQRTHSGERPYGCDVCGMAFTSGSHLIRHKRIHSGERPYGCDVCGKTFAASQHLIDHKRTHTGERPYRCDVCGMAFATSSKLTNHKRTHTRERPYSCDVCGKAFRQKACLTIHMRTHNGERQYCCDVCGNTFTQKSNLATHMRKHSGRPFRCSVCGKESTSTGDLTKHMRTHTEEELIVAACAANPSLRLAT